jgi:serine/threonine protein kinase
MFSSGTVLMKKFRLESQLGIGGFSEVWQATDLESDTSVAVKIFLKQDAEGIELCRDEYRRMERLRHQHILRPQFFSVHEGAPFIVMPYYERGTSMNKAGEMTETEVAQFLKQISSALDYIHTLPDPIIHNDIKPDNILIGYDGNYILTDFGIGQQLAQKLNRSIDDSRKTERMQQAESTKGVTPMAYRAPELFLELKDRPKRNVKTDIWALGATVYQLAKGEPPLGREGGMMQLTYHKSNEDIEIEDYIGILPKENFSVDLSRLILNSLNFKADKRPEAFDLQQAAEFFLERGEWPEVIVSWKSKLRKLLRKYKSYAVYATLLSVILILVRSPLVSDPYELIDQAVSYPAEKPATINSNPQFTEDAERTAHPETFDVYKNWFDGNIQYLINDPENNPVFDNLDSCRVNGISLTSKELKDYILSRKDRIATFSIDSCRTALDHSIDPMRFVTTWMSIKIQIKK